jgi:hypothetical protein
VSGDVKLVNATFAKSLSDNQEPVDPTDEFYPTETIYFSLEFDGRPKEGEVTSEFFLGDESIASASVDFADANSGVLISIGQSTFAGFNLTHENPLPISGDYRVESTLDGKKIGSFKFSVVPAADALPVNVSFATLAKGAEQDYTPIEPTDSFVAEDEVYLVGRGDFGVHSRLRIEWYVNGELDDAGSKVLGPLEENMADTGFSFYYRPDGGWAEGEHEAVLYVDDAKIESYAFTVGAAAVTPGGGVILGDPVAIGDLQTFSPDTGLFTIDVPSDWEMSDNSNELSANYSWTSPSNTAGVIVSIYANPEAQDEEALTTLGSEFVESVFGSEPDFEITEKTPQSDGSVLIAWTATPEIDGASVALVGLTYVEQRGDKISLLNALLPSDQYDALWDSHFNTIVNSYRIDPDAPIAQ